MRAIVFGLCLLGCKAEPRACDSAKVDALVERLASSDPHEHPDIIATELGRACVLPDFASHYLEIMAGKASQMSTSTLLEHSAESFARACPDVAKLQTDLTGPDRVVALYDGCDLARFDVISREDFLRQPSPSPVPWAIHQWLLDVGSSAAQARALTRGLLVFERRWTSPLDPIAGLRVPRVDVDLRAPLEFWSIVQISPTELQAFENKLATIESGAIVPADVRSHVVIPLYEQLESDFEKQREIFSSRDEDWVGKLVVAADRETSFGTLVDVFYTAGRIGYTEFGIVVETGAFEFELLPLDQHMAPAIVHVHVSETGYRLDQQGKSAGEIARDPELLRHRMLGFCSAELDARGVVTATNAVALEHVVEAIITLRGPGCRADGTGACCLANVGIESSGPG